jgi:hypothetical protein
MVAKKKLSLLHHQGGSSAILGAKGMAKRILSKW